MVATFPAAMETLRQAHAAVPWATATTADEMKQPVAAWVEALYQARQAADEEDGARLAAFARATAEEVAPKVHLFSSQVREAENELERLSRHGDWARYCHRRSAMEMAKCLYHGLTEGPGPFEFPGSGTVGLDDLSKQYEVEYGNLFEDEIPAFIPPSHWWWWAPDPPPEKRSPSPPMT
jgi:hypothetical protein